MKTCLGRGIGERICGFHVLQECICLQESHVFSSLQEPCPLVFLWRLTAQAVADRLGGYTQQGLPPQVLLGLSQQHSFLQDMGRAPLE